MEDHKFDDEQLVQIQEAKQHKPVEMEFKVVTAHKIGGDWDTDPTGPPLVQQSDPNKQKLLNGRYLKVKKLGQGSYNVVYLAEDLLPE